MTSLCVGDSHINRLKAYVGVSASSHVYNIAALEEVHYFGISGGRISNGLHLRKLYTEIQRRAPRHVIMMIGGNDIDTPDPHFDVDCFVYRFVAFLTRIKNLHHVRSVTALSLLNRTRTRHVTEQVFIDRTAIANQLLMAQCEEHDIKFWNLLGFTNSWVPLLRDGVHLNDYGQYKLLREIRGVLLRHI